MHFGGMRLPVLKKVARSDEGITAELWHAFPAVPDDFPKSRFPVVESGGAGEVGKCQVTKIAASVLSCSRVLVQSIRCVARQKYAGGHDL